MPPVFPVLEVLLSKRALTDDYPHATLETRAIIATTVVIASAAIMAIATTVVIVSAAIMTIAMAVMSVCTVAMPVIPAPVMPIPVVMTVGTGMSVIIAPVIGYTLVLDRGHIPSVYFAADYVAHQPPDGSSNQGGFSVSADCLAN